MLLLSRAAEEEAEHAEHCGDTRKSADPDHHSFSEEGRELCAAAGCDGEG